MKKRLVATLAGVLLLCAGCTQSVAPTTETPAPTPIPTESAEPTPTPTSTPGPVIEKTVRRWFGPGWVDKSPYGDLGEMTYLYQTDDMSIMINYPCIAGELEDSEINRLLADEALAYWGTDDAKQWEDGTPMGGSVDGDWTVSRSDEKLLSVRFRTEHYILGAARPRWEERTATIDRREGKLLSLADLVDTGDDFETWLNAQGWTQLNGWEGDSAADTWAYYRNCYLDRSENPLGHVRDFYLTDTDLVIIVWNSEYDTHFAVPLSDLKLKGDDLWNA